MIVVSWEFANANTLLLIRIFQWALMKVNTVYTRVNTDSFFLSFFLSSKKEKFQRYIYVVRHKNSQPFNHQVDKTCNIPTGTSAKE